MANRVPIPLDNFKVKRLRVKECIEETRGKTNIKNMAELADKLGVHHQSVLYWNQGQSVPRLPLFFYMCVVLGVDPLEIVEIEET